MSVELKIELTGAVVYVRQAGIAGEKVVALLLGRSKAHAGHMPLHRPTLVFNPDDVAQVAGLPAQIIHTAKHKLGLQVDMTGFDLALGEDSGSVGVEPGGSVPFKWVVDLKALVPAGAQAELNTDLLDRFRNPNPSLDPELLSGRLYLHQGSLYAVGPVAPEQLHILWEFTYAEGAKEHLQLATKATDRVVFQCVLPGDTLSFAKWGGGPQAAITLQRPSDGSAITARLACTPGLSTADITAGKALNVADNRSHFEMAYGVLKSGPLHKPTPRPSERVPGKNCFKAVQIFG